MDDRHIAGGGGGVCSFEGGKLSNSRNYPMFDAGSTLTNYFYLY